MKTISKTNGVASKVFGLLFLAFLLTMTVTPTFAMISPIGAKVTEFSAEFEGPIALAGSLIVVVLTGLALWLGDGRGKSVVIGGIFAVIFMMGAARIVAWLS